MSAVSEPLRPPTKHVTMEIADLVREHQAGVWRYLRFLGAEGTEAEDLTQETFLAALRKPFEQLSTNQTAGYLRTVARNQLLMLRSKQKRQISTVKLEAAETVWVQYSGNNGELDNYLDTLDDCLEKLPRRSRQAVELRYHDDVSRTEIARQLEMKTDGVKTLLRRTRQLLRDCVERQFAREN